MIIVIPFYAMIIAITVMWITIRLIAALKNQSVDFKREALLFAAAVWLTIILRFTFFPIYPINGATGVLVVNTDKLYPFQTNLIPFVNLFGKYDGWPLNLIGNILLFIPVGLICPLCFKKLDTIPKATLAGMGLSLMIELLQLLCLDRTTDVDDLMLNTLGTLIGAILLFLLNKSIRHNRKKGHR